MTTGYIDTFGDGIDEHRTDISEAVLEENRIVVNLNSEDKDDPTHIVLVKDNRNLWQAHTGRIKLSDAIMQKTDDQIIIKGSIAGGKGNNEGEFKMVLYKGR